LPDSDKKLAAAALTIAGSDSCGGAGVQADLKTFHALGVFGASAITAITAQNTLGVQAATPISAELLASQINAVLDDIPVTAIKTGMLPNAEAIEVVSNIIGDRCGDIPLIVDPVLVATSGDSLTFGDTLCAMKEKLIPLATLVTPNLEEARTFAPDAETSNETAREFLALGCQAVLLKGGHEDGSRITDWLIKAGEETAFSHPRIAGSFHGTGCTLSAAIAALMASGTDLNHAVGAGINHVGEKIKAARLSKSGSLYLLD